LLNTTFRSIINIGVAEAAHATSRRNIQLTNFICMGMVMWVMAILAFRIIFSVLQFWFFLPLGVEIVIFLSLIALNKTGLTNLTRLLLCWIPAVMLIINFQVLITHVPVRETSHYLGFRLFQVGFSFFPFVVFNLSEKRLMILAVSVPIVCTLFFDKILDVMGIGYSTSGFSETTYYYNNFRTGITLVIIASAFIFLKRIIESQELQNESLIRELSEKNIMIQRNAARELKKAYERLSYHIHNTPLAVIDRNEKFEITFWNKRAEELFGWTAEEVKGRRPQEFLVDPRDLARAIQTMDHALQQKLDSDFMEVRTVTKDGNVRSCLWYYSFLYNEQGELDTILSFVSDITEQRKANYALNERVKELRTLYKISQLLTNSGKSMHDAFENVTQLLPPGWQYPEVCAARLIVFDSIFQTDNYLETPFKQFCNIQIGNKDIGVLEVVYIDEKPIEYEGPFLKEEQELLVAIVQMLQVFIERKLEEDEVLKAQANLSATINNTEIIIWSVDQSFNVITYNHAFRKFAGETLGIKIVENNPSLNFPEAMNDKWRERYKKVLGGEIISFEETTMDIDFRYSLSPIIDHAAVIGVTIFADNVTDRNQKNRELATANQKIADLKVLALRSVMNPHFIFNVLSSIQYFITRNDELNAINYLTSFSKLMRTVLTRSVADSVTLQDEIQLLKDYVHLERLRFEDKFDFTVTYDEDLDTEDMRLPSLLVQPYVENAILHGLYNKEGRGLLVVKVSVDESFLVFEIQDDGIGRDAAQKISQKNPSKTKSMGTQLTEERLMMLNNNGESPVIFTDLFNNGEPAGTRVTIRIKINPN
jgi:PAS domain S-box-containing protein